MNSKWSGKFYYIFTLLHFYIIMNNKTRKEISKMVETLKDYKAVMEELTETNVEEFSINGIKDTLEKIASYEETVDGIRERIEEIKEEEEEKLDNMPDSFRYSEKGDKQEEICEYLNDAVDESELYDEDANLLDLMNAVESVVDSLENTIE